MKSRHITRYFAGKRSFHASSTNNAISKFAMPAMSPTMTEGGIAQWKKKEGESFSAGDVLLEIETDKATIDVEAQDDGVLGKIIAPDGSKNVPVGKTIALIAEEGDDISNLQVPLEDGPPSSTQSSSNPESAKKQVEAPPPAPSAPPSHSAHDIEHSRPLFPSVMRLLLENNITDANKIKGTGVRGMLTKGDVLAFLGKASGPFGTYKEINNTPQPVAKVEPPKPLDGATLRKLLTASLVQQTRPKPSPIVTHDFNSIIADYLPKQTSVPASAPLPPHRAPSSSSTYFDGLF